MALQAIAEVREWNWRNKRSITKCCWSPGGCRCESSRVGIEGMEREGRHGKGSRKEREAAGKEKEDVMPGEADTARMCLGRASHRSLLPIKRSLAPDS